MPCSRSAFRSPSAIAFWSWKPCTKRTSVFAGCTFTSTSSGGTRTSSFLAALFSNTGVLGGLLFMAFLLKALLGRSHHDRSTLLRSVQRGLFFAFLPPFANLLMVGTSTDFGLPLAYLLGIKLGLMARHPARASAPVPAPLLQGAR